MHSFHSFTSYLVITTYIPDSTILKIFSMIILLPNNINLIPFTPIHLLATVIIYFNSNFFYFFLMSTKHWVNLFYYLIVNVCLDLATCNIYHFLNSSFLPSGTTHLPHKEHPSEFLPVRILLVANCC